MDAAESRASSPSERAAGGADAGLTEREREILEFERRWWRYAGAKDAAIKEKFGFSGTRYYQILNGLLTKEEAVRMDPMLVKRLRKTRSARRRSRAARRLGIELR